MNQPNIWTFWSKRLDILPLRIYNQHMKIEIKVVIDTDEPKDQTLVEQIMQLVEDIKERLNADS